MAIKIYNYEVEFNKFPNGEIKMDESSIKFMVSGEEYVTIAFKYEDDSDLIKLMFLKKYLDSILSSDVEISLSITYMPYSRMDRVEDDSAFTLKYVAEFINSMEFSRVEVLDAHSDVTPALLNNYVHVSATEHLLNIATKDVAFDDEVDYLVYPDDGARKRYGKIFKARNILIGYKERDFKTGFIDKVEIIGSYNGVGKTAIIVDDLSSYGGTFVKTSKKLREMGFEKVYLVVTHAENSTFDGELFNYIDKVFATDSILTEHNDCLSRQYASQLEVSPLIWREDDLTL